MRAARFLFASLTVAALCGAAWAQEKQEPKDDAKAGTPGEHMSAMLAKAKKYIEPGKHHKELERFLGKWNIETRVFMGDQAGPPEKGTAEYTWLMPGRWLQGRWNGTFMGRPMEGFSLMGYDNFKQSFVAANVSNFDTAMNYLEGDMDPTGQALISYGTLDEYLTGEHDKMVKYVWRFPAPDKFILEIHDLPIGEKNTKVIEFTYTKAEDSAPAK